MFQNFPRKTTIIGSYDFFHNNSYKEDLPYQDNHSRKPKHFSFILKKPAVLGARAPLLYFSPNSIFIILYLIFTMITDVSAWLSNFSLKAACHMPIMAYYFPTSQKVNLLYLWHNYPAALCWFSPSGVRHFFNIVPNSPRMIICLQNHPQSNPLPKLQLPILLLNLKRLMPTCRSLQMPVLDYPSRFATTIP